MPEVSGVGFASAGGTKGVAVLGTTAVVPPAGLVEAPPLPPAPALPLPPLPLPLPAFPVPLPVPDTVVPAWQTPQVISQRLLLVNHCEPHSPQDFQLEHAMPLPGGSVSAQAWGGGVLVLAVPATLPPAFAPPCPPAPPFPGLLGPPLLPDVGVGPLPFESPGPWAPLGPLVWALLPQAEPRQRSKARENVVLRPEVFEQVRIESLPKVVPSEEWGKPVTRDQERRTSSTRQLAWAGSPGRTFLYKSRPLPPPLSAAPSRFGQLGGAAPHPVGGAQPQGPQGHFGVRQVGQGGLAGSRLSTGLPHDGHG